MGNKRNIDGWREKTKRTKAGRKKLTLNVIEYMYINAVNEI